MADGQANGRRPDERRRDGRRADSPGSGRPVPRAGTPCPPYGGRPLPHRSRRSVLARVTVHSVADAPEASRDALEGLEATFGTVLTIHGEMAHAPVVLNGYAALQQAIADHGTFDAATREAVALVVGTVDECSYCQAAHTGGARKAGLTEEQTVAIRRGEVDWDPRLAALLALFRESAGRLGHVDDATWQAALDAGWSDAELTEASVHIALNLFTNHFNHLVETDLDLPAAPAL